MEQDVEIIDGVKYRWVDRSRGTKLPYNHYDWMEVNLKQFGDNLGITFNLRCLISPHGDKCRGSMNMFKDAGFPEFHGAAIYLLTYISPYDREVRETKNGWVDPRVWCLDNYERFKPHLPL